MELQKKLQFRDKIYTLVKDKDRDKTLIIEDLLNLSVEVLSYLDKLLDYINLNNKKLEFYRFDKLSTALYDILDNKVSYRTILELPTHELLAVLEYRECKEQVIHHLTIYKHLTRFYKQLKRLRKGLFLSTSKDLEHFKMIEYAKLISYWTTLEEFGIYNK